MRLSMPDAQIWTRKMHTMWKEGVLLRVASSAMIRRRTEVEVDKAQGKVTVTVAKVVREVGPARRAAAEDRENC
jgi:hypothetical protein